MATYNTIISAWTISLGTNGTDILYLTEIINNHYTQKYNILNLPTPSDFNNLDLIVNKVYEPLCINFTTKINIIPSYYGFDLINLLDLDTSSQHLTGNALDIDIESLGRGITNKQLFYYIKDNLEFDNLIWEFGNDQSPQYVHISYNSDQNSGNILKLLNKGTNYLQFETTPTLFNGLSGQI